MPTDFARDLLVEIFWGPVWAAPLSTVEKGHQSNESYERENP